MKYWIHKSIVAFPLHRLCLLRMCRRSVIENLAPWLKKCASHCRVFVFSIVASIALEREWPFARTNASKGLLCHRERILSRGSEIQSLNTNLVATVAVSKFGLAWLIWTMGWQITSVSDDVWVGPQVWQRMASIVCLRRSRQCCWWIHLFTEWMQQMQSVKDKHTIGVSATESELCRQYQPSRPCNSDFDLECASRWCLRCSETNFANFWTNKHSFPVDLMKNLMKRCYSLFHPKCQLMRNLQDKSLTFSAGY